MMSSFSNRKMSAYFSDEVLSADYEVDIIFHYDVIFLIHRALFFRFFSFFDISETTYRRA